MNWLIFQQVMPIFEEYVEAIQTGLTQQGCDLLSPQVKTQSRRSAYPQIQQIFKLIGTSTTLYTTTTELLAQRFLETNNKAFATARYDLVMKFHDEEVSEIYNEDGCHPVAWCIDACLLEGGIDQRHLNHLKVCLKSCAPDTAAFRDSVFVLCSPMATNLLCSSLWNRLKEATAQELLPKNDDNISFLCAACLLSSKAHEIVSGNSVLPNATELLQSVCPRICSLLIDIQLSTLGHPVESNALMQSATRLSTHPIGILLLGCLIVQLTKDKTSETTLSPILRTAALSSGSGPIHQSIVSVLIGLKDWKYSTSLLHILAPLAIEDSLNNQIVRYIIDSHSLGQQSEINDLLKISFSHHDQLHNQSTYLSLINNLDGKNIIDVEGIKEWAKGSK